MQQTHRDDCCRDARSERPLSNQLDAVTFNGDGRTDRASLQGDVGGDDERGGATCECAGGAPSGWFVGTAVRVSGAVCRRVGHGMPAVSGRCRDGRCG